MLVKQNRIIIYLNHIIVNLIISKLDISTRCTLFFDLERECKLFFSDSGISSEGHFISCTTLKFTDNLSSLTKFTMTLLVKTQILINYYYLYLLQAIYTSINQASPYNLLASMHNCKRYIQLTPIPRMHINKLYRKTVAIHQYQWAYVQTLHE